MILELKESMASHWIWGILLSAGCSREIFLSGKMPHLICGWITAREVTAATVVNEYTESELFQVIHKYGKINLPKNIAKHIVQERQEGTGADHRQTGRDCRSVDSDEV